MSQVLVGNAQVFGARGIIRYGRRRRMRTGGSSMKVRMLLVGLAAVALTASSALAAQPADKGKKPTTGAGCKPQVTVVLKGTLKVAPLSVDVTSGNRWGRAYVEGTANTPITVNDDTKVRRQGKAEIRRPRAWRPCSRPGEGLQGRPQGQRDACVDGTDGRCPPGEGREGRRRQRRLVPGRTLHGPYDSESMRRGAEVRRFICD